MWPNSTLSFILASGLIGTPACNWRQAALATPFQTTKTEPASPGDSFDNKPSSPQANIAIPGFLSEGDFGNTLYLLFAQESDASFLMEGLDRVNKRKTVRARFYGCLRKNRPLWV
jgi:hypothetical protein